MPGACVNGRSRGSRRCLGVLLALAVALPCAAQPVHLLGFVGTLCSDQPYCFELLVKPEFRAALGDRVRVHFNSKTRIFDPENYQLTLAQQNIVPGSHLRLLIDREAGSESSDYLASYIWIGD